MAVVVQDEFVTGILKPLYTINNEPNRNRTSEPFGILQFALSFEVDLIALGNDAVLRITLNMPEGFAYLYKSLNMMLREGVNNDTVTTWRDPFLRMFYARTVREAITAAQIEMDYPLASYFKETEGASTEDRWLVGGFGGALAHDAVIVDAGMSVPGPEYLTYGLPPNDTTNPTIIMQNRTADIGPWTMNLVSEWYAFNIEQGEHSALNWPFPVRP